MRIGLILRTVDEDQGIGIYTRNLVPRLLAADPRNEYLLIFRSKRSLGRFPGFPNASEIVLRAPTKFVWEHFAVPWIARKRNVDVLFNPKFSVPLLTRRPTVMMMHGMGWYTHPEDFGTLDVLASKRLLPLSARRAAHILSNSERTTRDIVEWLGVPASKITTNPLAADDVFVPVTDAAKLSDVRRRYGLPAKFLLSVTKYFRGKNVPRLIDAWRGLPAGIRCPLVLVGRGADRYLDDMGIRDTDLASQIVTPGWIEQSDLPAVYSLAEALVFPSLFESFGIPVVEAMRCGCPVIASNTGATPGLTLDAALLVDPRDEAGLRAAIERVLSAPSYREELRRRGLERGRAFDWNQHARTTHAVLERAGGGGG